MREIAITLSNTTRDTITIMAELPFWDCFWVFWEVRSSQIAMNIDLEDATPSMSKNGIHTSEDINQYHIQDATKRGPCGALFA
tara:strand:- start:279 stop:527 length:249 start_codon:yes stop_codon:yes gene_type:complete